MGEHSPHLLPGPLGQGTALGCHAHEALGGKSAQRPQPGQPPPPTSRHGSRLAGDTRPAQGEGPGARGCPPPHARAWDTGTLLHAVRCSEKGSHARQRGTAAAWADAEVAAYLRMATVSASGEPAQGQMTSGRSPLDWKTLRNASQEDMDPARDRGSRGVTGRLAGRGQPPMSSSAS